MKRILFAWILFWGLGATAQNPGTDVLGAHDMSASGLGGVRGQLSAACLYCHAPHSGIGKGPLWSQQLSTKVYPNLYTSDSLQNTPNQPVLGDNSSLCLSCHDGTIAPGLTVPYGQITMSKPMSQGNLLPDLANSHPFSLKLPLKDAAHLVPSLVASGTTADVSKAVKLINGNIECSTCHNPHNQYVDGHSWNFLVRDNAKGGLCLSCHEIKPRTVNTRNNPLSTWTTSSHATSAAAVTAGSGLGTYATVGDLGCVSCHAPHNAGSAPGLLRNPGMTATGVDAGSQACMTCHTGSNKLVVPLNNVFATYQAGNKSHIFPTSSAPHTMTEPTVLVQNRHAGCADCHNAHAASSVTTFGAAPNIRASQNGMQGVAADGTVLTAPATRQFETCLRCHGTGAGKQVLEQFGYAPSRMLFAGDPLNLISQFGATAASYHPVMRDATGRQQRSLRASMLDFNGAAKRAMGTRIFCTDCHNNENNREFGGNTPNGPHGSANDHILERRYDMSYVNAGTFPSGGPGSPIANLVPPATLLPGAANPYNLCAKCHDLTNVVGDNTFKHHAAHINRGVSCSVCHSAHGVPNGSSGMAGDRLVNFDIKVVAPYRGSITYSNQKCNLTCHMTDHNGTGSKPTPHLATTPLSEPAPVAP